MILLVIHQIIFECDLIQQTLYNYLILFKWRSTSFTTAITQNAEKCIPPIVTLFPLSQKQSSQYSGHCMVKITVKLIPICQLPT